MSEPAREQLLSNVSLDDRLALQSLAIDPTSELFYAASAGGLCRLDSTTSLATFVGATSLSVGVALGFDSSGNLYGTRGLVATETPALVGVDKSTGATSLIATILALPANIVVRPSTGVIYGLGYAATPNDADG